MRVLQQQVDRLQAALQDARAERVAAESQLRVVVNQASLQQHRSQQGAASLHKVQAEAEAARREVEDLRRVRAALPFVLCKWHLQ
jgi:predicted  nucleic acid-binding Zn-ribbon protein